MLFFRKKISYLLEAFLGSFVIALLIPLAFLIRAVITHHSIGLKAYLSGFIYSFIVSFCIYYFNIRIVETFQDRYKDSDKHFKRILIELVITTCLSAAVISIVLSIFLYFSGYKWEHAASGFFDNIVVAIIVNTIVVAITEILYFFRKWKNSLIESEQLKRQTIESQYAALTSQINPHFLFNSLNTLGSLIQSDPAKALVFNREFSKIYRYVLDTKDKLVVSLDEELNFLNSYFNLQKIRFDKGLHYSIEIDGACLELYLPALSLQLLIENAIKHNEISEDNPLKIVISATGEELKVINNFQPIDKEKHEEGIGLKNLTERYAHYSQIKPVFKVENNQYIAIIPLIRDE
jgi:two-component system LytT family sensor kinase